MSQERAGPNVLHDSFGLSARVTVRQKILTPNLQMKPYIELMSDPNPFFAVTFAVFGVYVVLALFGSRERGAETPPTPRNLQRRLRDWKQFLRLRRWFS